MKYVSQLARGFTIPADESGSAHSPFLPFIIPAIYHSLEYKFLGSTAKFIQFLNFLLSLLTFLFFLKILRLLNRSNFEIFLALWCLSIFPVYYRTFSMARPQEPMLAFFTIVSIYFLIVILRKNKSYLNIFLLVTSLGAVLLSRRTGIAVFVTILLAYIIGTIKSTELSRKAVFHMGALLFPAVLIASTFYVPYLIKTGLIIKYHENSASTFSFANRPLEFYFKPHFYDLFTSPTEKNLTNRLLPGFYADTWGDTFGYFFRNQMTRIENKREEEN